MANSFSPPRRNAMAPVQPVANVPMAVAPLYSAPTPQDAEVLKRFLLGAGKAALAGVQFPGDLMHDAARSLRAGRPAGVYADLVETARRVSRDPAAVPGMVVNALKAQAEQARSSPGAMAETMGGMLDVRNMLKPKPQVMEIGGYHGTRPDIAEIIRREGFDMSKQGTAQKFEAQIPGAWFSASPQIAKKFGKEVLEAELDLKKPYRMKAASYLQKFFYNGEDPKAFAEKLKAKGYDGVHIKFEPEYEGGYGPSGTEEWGFDNYVVFDPYKIKVK